MSYAAHIRDQRRRPSAGLLGAGLELTRRCAGLVAGLRERGDGRARWLELRNKVAAYKLFQGHYRDGGAGPEALLGLDPYARLFAAEGYAYRNVARAASASELPPWLSRIAVHAGVGLRLAESALKRIDAGEREGHVLDEFSAACGRDSLEGFGGIVEEALGFAARTLRPRLVGRLDERLRATDARWRARFWHGAGRGIYFTLGNLLPSRAAPWGGVRLCSSEPPDEASRRNALSGFCFALTLVNLRQAEVRDAFFKHHAARRDDCSDGARAALSVWALSGGEGETGETREVEDEDRRRPERLFSARAARGS
jgi:hypothetical protein